ncbi:glutathione binding-like protein [Cystobacter ferrugineus]|uniref:GST C-terminal domain-containing protein n=1 Tax=Cystobacter ferrugineus TaxID=83449 RepID=A0A1L9AUK1_9BACT|nr:glutathione binding-like protein [Cystobacter ferrugineus]OJH33666.1 hypothetical protein BON30_47360 [Cystobacter ferrugineus]
MTVPVRPLRLYRHALSGHSHRVELFLSLLKLPSELIDVDLALANRSFLVGEAATLADVALYSYTAHAPEGGVSLEPYGSVRAWLARIEALPGFVPMRRTPTRFAA